MDTLGKDENALEGLNFDQGESYYASLAFGRDKQKRLPERIFEWLHRLPWNIRQKKSFQSANK